MAHALQRGVVIPSVARAFKETTMLYWTAVFLVIALVAAVLGFGGLASGAAWFAKILFIAFLVLAAVSFLFGRRARV